MSRHKWKRTKHWETHYCEECGLTRFTHHTAAGPRYRYGVENLREEPHCKPPKPAQRELKLTGFVIALLLILYSCDCNYYYTKAQKKCAGKRVGDSTTVKGSVLSPVVVHDTLFHYKQSDTVIIKEGQSTVKYFYRNDTVYIYQHCDTVRVPFVVKIPPPEVPQFNWSAFLYSYKWVLLIILLCILATVVILFVIIRELKGMVRDVRK